MGFMAKWAKGMEWEASEPWEMAAMAKLIHVRFAVEGL